MTIKKNKKLTKVISVAIDNTRKITLEIEECWHSPMVICLCNRCASPFFHSADRRILRVDYYQSVFDTCDMCGLGKGLDFVIFEYSKKDAA